ncbi:MAG: oligosaccharide flippase family protein [Thiotrichaceae bacterium]|nr:oligosaccharide flippase family protein [Thiotrichaceae bacterium]
MNAVNHTSQDNAGVLNRLKKLAVTGSLLSIFGFGSIMLMRLGGNVIVAGWLYPEAFGLMAVVNALMMGLAMFSDVGLRPSIVQNKRGEEADFLRTAWTIQVARGFVLALFSVALAFPIAAINNEPQLVILVIVTGFSSIFMGFNSTYLFVYSRRLDLRNMVILDIIAAFLSTAVMLVWAYYYPSIWALVSSAFVNAIVRLIASHTVLAGSVPMRFQWEKQSVHELVHFGKWIFISTALGFLLMRLDIFILGSFAGMATLGVYSIAKTLSRISIEALMKLSDMVMFPLYSRLREQGADTLREKMFKTRMLLLALFLPPLWVLILGGDWIVGLLYDELYQFAGWMLQVLAAGATATVIITSIYPVLLAVGDSFRNMLNSITRFIMQLLGMMVGYYLGGVEGFIIGVAMADLFTYGVLVFLIRPYNVWFPWLDFAAFSSSLGVIWIAFGVL